MMLALILALLLVGGPAAALTDDLDDSYKNLQDAVSKKDSVLVKKLAAQTFDLAHHAASEPAPADADQQDSWKKRIESIQSYAEYALYATAVQAEPGVTVDLMATLESQNPKSKYLDQGYGVYMVALAKTGGSAKVVALADKAIQNFPQNPDLLLVLANDALNRKQADRALGFANRLLSALSKGSKPDSESGGAGESNRNASLASGYWISGTISAEKGLFGAADKNLRAALPLIRGDDYRTGVALFYLGVSNYQIGKATLDKAKILEAAKFSDEAAKLNTPMAHQAFLNAQIMKTEAGKIR